MKISSYMNNMNPIIEKMMLKFIKKISRQMKNIRWNNP